MWIDLVSYAPAAQPDQTHLFSFDIFYLFTFESCVVLFSCLYIVNQIRFFGFGYHAPFKGIPIQVREPKTGWKEEIKDFHLGGNIFWNMIFLQMSAFLVSFEASVSKLTVHHDDCAGLISQEMNHALMHAMLNVAASKKGFPTLFWQRFFQKLASVLPIWVVQGMGGAAESQFLVWSVQGLKCRLVDWVPFPRSVWIMHLLEESEHCWLSSDDLLEDLNIFQRCIGVFFQFFFFGCFIIIPGLSNAFIYCWRELLFEFRILDLFEFMALGPILNFNSMLVMIAQVVLRMRPSDETYWRFTRDIRELYKPYEHLFRVTHVQNPAEDIARRKSFEICAREGNANESRKVSIYFYQKQARLSVHAPGPGISKCDGHVLAEAPRVLALRTVAYATASFQLREAGLSAADISAFFMEDPQLMQFVPDERRPEVTSVEVDGSDKLEIFTHQDVVKSCDVPQRILIIINDMVLDVSKFQNEHPGGIWPLRAYAGQDVTDIFNLIHGQVKTKWSKYVVGRVVASK